MTSHETHVQEGQATGPAVAEPPARPSPPTAWTRIVGLALGLSLLVGLLFTAFAWPNTEIAPREVPVAVVGPPEAVDQVEQQLESAVPGGFDIEPAADANAARDLITDREVYGAIVIDPAGPPQVLTASAASPAVAQVLRGIGDELTQAATGAPGAQVEDVVATPADDPRGSGFAAAALPMVMAGLATGYLMSLLVTSVWRRVAGALLAAAAAGPVAGLVAQGWLGVLDGDYLVNSGVIALTVAAISTALIGLQAVLGNPGIGLGAVIMLLLGNPLSGVTSAPELLPTGWSTLGQLLPPGAGGTLLRATSFFDGAAAAGPLLVLGGWVAAGLLLATVGWLAKERRAAGVTLAPVPVAGS